MSTLTSCPSCSRQLRVPDELLGRQVKCPQCGTMFTVGGGDSQSAAIAAEQERLGEPLREVSGSRQQGASAVKGPGVCLLITSILNVIGAFIFLGVGYLYTANADQMFDAAKQAQQQGAFQGAGQVRDEDLRLGIKAYGIGGTVAGLLALAMALPILLGSIKMLRLKSIGFAYTASILAMIPVLSPCCLLGLPFGIWALVVLSKPEVKSAFS